MIQARVSDKYQVVIPEEVRKKFNIRKRQKLTFVTVGNHIELIPDRDIAEMEGAFPGLTSEALRDEEDRY
jgi:AbrB family looped-hinge helix DNA binding protein